MNPLLKKNLDTSNMSEQEKKLFEMYGKKPQKNVLSNMQKERKYFDSGDYAMQKAGVGSDIGGRPLQIGTTIPTPEGLPHASPPSLSSSPTNPSLSSPPGPNPLQSPSVPPANPVPGHQHTGSNSSASGTVGVIAAKAGEKGGPGNGSGTGSSVGVGIAIPGAGKANDPRRSPPTSFSPLSSSHLSHGSLPPSSFPIQHRESVSLTGSSPVKGSGLGAGVIRGENQ